MNIFRKKDDGLTRGQKVAVGVATLCGGLLLKPFAKAFVNELLWEGADVSDLSGDGREPIGGVKSITGLIVSLAVGAVCKRSATAIIKNGPELLSSWGNEIMTHGGKALCRMHDTLADAGSNVLDFAKDALGLNADVTMGVADTAASVAGDAAGEALMSGLGLAAEESSGEVAGTVFEKFTEMLGETLS